MAEESSVYDHCVQMLSFVKKLEDLKTGIENDIYIDVFLQSFPPSYDPFVVNYNMNGFKKFIPKLINILVQEIRACGHVGKASTSKNDKRAWCWKKKKSKTKGQPMIENQLSRPQPLAKGKRKKV
ncbi:UNVERIFIED_CONTAM: hypothetical protein Sradi_1562300 [Sesamum radiatum]|uniref:UBN2 domain-containing protein n=1 Tax=Sesamum radiatum TaxID=300843 RepID=A0AAW2UDH3_SESRA